MTSPSGTAGPQEISDGPRPGAVDIEFRSASKRFGEVLAVDDLCLTIDRGAFFTFLGPSGCGKTTSLRLIAGFEQPTAGDVHIGGVSVVGVPPHRRPVNMVFQHYALFPHLSVADNVAYGLRQQTPRPPRTEITRQMAAMLELVQLPGFGRRRVWELSGGQQQRVALARALINRPTVLLLDEPLAALDRKLRREMQIELQTLQREVGITFVLVTHDQEEALSMSDRICIMNAGRIVQSGSPEQLYDQPINRYVADFVGKSNFFPGQVEAFEQGLATVKVDDDRVLHGRPPPEATPVRRGDGAVIAVRPELVHVCAPGSPQPEMDVALHGRIKNRIFLGEHTEYLVATRQHGDVLALVHKHLESSTGGFDLDAEVLIGWRSTVALALADS